VLPFDVEVEPLPVGDDFDARRDAVGVAEDAA